MFLLFVGRFCLCGVFCLFFVFFGFMGFFFNLLPFWVWVFCLLFLIMNQNATYSISKNTVHLNVYQVYKYV